MVTTVAAEEVTQIWEAFKADPNNQEMRNRLVEMYLPLVKYNGERIWSRLPEGVELDDLVSAGVFGLMDAIDAFDLGRIGHRLIQRHISCGGGLQAEETPARFADPPLDVRCGCRIGRQVHQHLRSHRGLAQQ